MLGQKAIASQATSSTRSPAGTVRTKDVPAIMSGKQSEHCVNASLSTCVMHAIRPVQPDEAAQMMFEESSLDSSNDTDISDSEDDSDFLYELGDSAMSSDENDSGDDDGAEESESERAADVQNPGLQITGSTIPDSAGDSFALFFTTDLVQEIVNETNRYAKEKLSNLELKRRSIWHT
ncbi:hypothetical protein ACOME3_009027 [Neoechinorhynchus agilis]